MYRSDLTWRQQREGEDNETASWIEIEAGVVIVNPLRPLRMASTRSAESCDMEPSTTALESTTVVYWYGRWVFVQLMVMAAGTDGWSAIML